MGVGVTVAFLAHNQKTAGSTPAPPTIFCLLCLRRCLNTSSKQCAIFMWGLRITASTMLLQGIDMVSTTIGSTIFLRVRKHGNVLRKKCNGRASKEYANEVVCGKTDIQLRVA